jgi:hypothetical protein
MPATQGQKNKVETVMHEFKDGDLRSSSGRKVTNRKQAVAIALSESGQSNQQSPKKKREKKRESAHARAPKKAH